MSDEIRPCSRKFCSALFGRQASSYSKCATRFQTVLAEGGTPMLGWVVGYIKIIWRTKILIATEPCFIPRDKCNENGPSGCIRRLKFSLINLPFPSDFDLAFFMMVFFTLDIVHSWSHCDTYYTYVLTLPSPHELGERAAKVEPYFFLVTLNLLELIVSLLTLHIHTRALYLTVTQTFLVFQSYAFEASAPPTFQMRPRPAHYYNILAGVLALRCGVNTFLFLEI